MVAMVVAMVMQNVKLIYSVMMRVVFLVKPIHLGAVNPVIRLLLEMKVIVWMVMKNVGPAVILQ
jgi:hypothetical protein